MSILILLAFYSVLIVINSRKKGTVQSSSNFVLFIYAFSALMSLFLVFVYGVAAPRFFSVLIFVCMLAPYLLPLLFMPDQGNVRPISIQSKLPLRVTVVTFSVVGIFSMIYYLRFLPEILSFSDFSVGRNYTTQKGISLNSAAGGAVSRIATLGANLYLVFISLSAYFFLVKKRINWMACLMFFFSTSIFIITLTRFGRDGIIIWGGPIVVAFFLVKHCINQKSLKIIGLSVLPFFVVMLIWFYAVTKDRFAHSKTGVVYSLVSYSGQQVFNFERTLDVSSNFKLQMGKANFPLFVSGFNVGKARSYDYFASKDRLADFRNEGMFGGVFGTFLKSFLADFGVLGTILFGTVFSVSLSLYFNQVRRRNCIDLTYILVSLCYCAFLINGLFYHIWGNTSQNIIYLYVPALGIYYGLTKRPSLGAMNYRG